MNDSIKFAQHIRMEALKMVRRARASHIGGALSCADILAVLYADGGILNIQPANPQWPERDRFIMSKGHCCSALYAALALRGFFPQEELTTYGADGSRLRPIVSHAVPGVEFSASSLGHGLPYACGLALAAKKRGAKWRTFVLIGDGELQEGSNWEAFMFAAHHKLGNLVVIVDDNAMQALGSCDKILDVRATEPMRSMGWWIEREDGHNHGKIHAALSLLRGIPTCLFARTIKGKGVDFMEGDNDWHYKPPNDAQLASALSQIGAAA